MAPGDMESTVILNGWTTAANCVTWSHDNVIAVGVRDGVALVAPRTDKTSDNESFWRVANLDVGSFSNEEVPTREPLPWSFFSIGQEISERHIVDVAWSAPGLGTFGRSVLAVLSANQVLSIYDCVGKLDAKESWIRTGIVNKTLEAEIPRTAAGNTTSARSAFAQRQRSVRVTSFCWIAPPETHNGRTHLQARFSRKTFFIAVTDENADVRIIRVQPPLNLLDSHHKAWRLDVVERFSLALGDPVSNPVTSCFPCSAPTFEAKFIDQMVWSPWVQNDNGTLVATLAYTYQSSLITITMTVQVNEDSIKFISHGTPGRAASSSIRSPLMWIPTPTSPLQNTLLYQSDDGLARLDVRYSAETTSQETIIHQSSPPWSTIVGIGCVSSDSGQVEVYAPTVDSDFSENVTHNLEGGQQDPPSLSDLAKHINTLKRKFDRARELEGNIGVHVHGFATSPLGDFSAPLVSMHPKHGLEYSILAKQESHVMLSRIKTTKEGRIFHADNKIIETYALAAEVVFHAIARLRKLEAIPDLGAIQEQLVQLMGYEGAPQITSSADKPAPKSVSGAVTGLRELLLSSAASIQLRTKRLIEIALEANSLRFSNTPRGSPKVVNAQKSPVHSIRPEMELHRDDPSKSYMEIDSSDDEEQHPATVRPADIVHRISPHRSHFNGRDVGIALQDTNQGVYHNSTPVPNIAPIEGVGHPRPADIRFSGISSMDSHRDLDSFHSSFDGSVTEMQIGDTQLPTVNKLRHKGHLPTTTVEPTPEDEDDQMPILTDVDQSKVILEAHKLTLLALQQNGDRKTMTPPPLQVNRNSQHITKPSAAMSAADSQLSTKAVRKVSVVPPPIDVSRVRTFKGKPIPSPYPIARNRPVREQLASPRSDYSLRLQDSTLHLRLNARHRNRPARSTTISIPPAFVADFSSIKTGPSKDKEKHLRALDYDDASFALSLRKAYTSLLPLTYRLFAARSLARITVAGATSKFADRSYGWIPSNSRPTQHRTLSASGYEVSATHSPALPSRSTSPAGPSSFNEAKLMHLFRHPKRAKARYAWVGWARKIADADALRRGEGYLGASAAQVEERIDALAGQMSELVKEMAETIKGAVEGQILSLGSSRAVSSAGLGQGLGQGQGHQRAVSGRASVLSPGTPGTPFTPFSVATNVNARRDEEKEDEFEGLEFVLGWDVGKIVAFLGVVVLLAIAAALLWIFLGPRSGGGFLMRPAVLTEGLGGVSRYQGAGDRVGAGVVLGICTLLVGLTAFGAWIGVSWLVV
ncbi:Hypothetical protein D9617_10g074420 [Elsinoe fawcettii]|nr:Hypothetical protein D9617_10g074420 [Elsinoe fawcettii]